MQDAHHYVGRFLLDLRSGEPRIYEIMQHLKGVYLIGNADEQRLLTSESLLALEAQIYDSVKAAQAAAPARTTAEADPAPPAPETEQPSNPPSARDPERRPLMTVPPIIDVVHAALSLTQAQADILASMLKSDAYAQRCFQNGILAGHELRAINLVDAQIACRMNLSTLVEAIVDFKKMNLLEVVSEQPATEGAPEVAQYWVIINPDCEAALSSDVTPIGMVA